MEIKSVYNWLGPEDQSYVVDRTLYGADWVFGGYSNDPRGLKFWHMNLNDVPFFKQKMLDRICEETQTEWRLRMVYANGQTHGLSGSMHQDMSGDPGKYYTLLYYANPEWDPAWGGATVFVDPDTGNTIVRPPTPNSMILFDSTIWHAGLEPTRHCTDLRVTVAWKLEKP